jgi:hypothetical protein
MNKEDFRDRLAYLAFLAAILLFAATLVSCSKSGEASFSDLPVVEAYLAPGSKISVTVTQKTPYSESAAVPTHDLNALGVTIGYAGTEYALTPMGNGVYLDSSGTVPVVPDSTYTLRLTWSGGPVTSFTVVPSKPASVTQSATSIKMSQFDPENPVSGTHPDPVTINFANADESYYLATVECIDSVRVSVYKDSVPANDMLWSQPVTGSEIEIRPMSIRYFGLNRIILYHINPEYTTFFMRQASTSQNYQDPPTNITGGLGIFTGINADTLYLDVIQTSK